MATTTSVTSALTDVPTILQPYITGAGGVLPTAQGITGQSYDQMYGNALKAAGLAGSGRVASLSPMQNQVGTALQNMTLPGQFATGTNAVQSGIGTLQGMTDAGQTQAFMSPYIQNVMDVNKQEALRDAQKQLVGANLASSRQGTYGGARNALMQSEADRNLQTQMGNIQATGSQQAFQNAQQQFNTSQQQQQAANQANLQAMLGVQQLGSSQYLDAQRANQAAGMQRAAGLGQIGQTYGALGQGLGQQGALQEQSDLARSTALGAYGGSERAVAQQQLDAQYQDQMRALAFPEQQLGSLSNILRGTPLGDTTSTQTTTAPPPSFASQLAGVGLSGLSLFNMLGKP